MQLNDADLDGPVTFSFSGVAADKDKKPASGHGTAGHLRITRGGPGGSDYELHVSGGTTLTGSNGEFDINFKEQAATIVIDESGNFVSFVGADSASGAINSHKRPA